MVRAANSQVAGFAFLHAYHPASTFKNTPELTYFIHPNHTRRGLGALLLEKLLKSAREQGVKGLVASISSLNEGRLAFHKKHAFEERGQFVKGRP